MSREFCRISKVSVSISTPEFMFSSNKSLSAIIEEEEEDIQNELGEYERVSRLLEAQKRAMSSHTAASSVHSSQDCLPNISQESLPSSTEIIESGNSSISTDQVLFKTESMLEEEAKKSLAQIQRENRQLLAEAHKEVDRRFLNRSRFIKAPSATFEPTYEDKSFEKDAKPAFRWDEKAKKSLDYMYFFTFGKRSRFYKSTSTNAIINPRKQAKQFLKQKEFKSRDEYSAELNKIMFKCTRKEVRADFELHKIITRYD